MRWSPYVCFYQWNIDGTRTKVTFSHVNCIIWQKVTLCLVPSNLKSMCKRWLSNNTVSFLSAAFLIFNYSSIDLPLWCLWCVKYTCRGMFCFFLLSGCTSLHQKAHIKKLKGNRHSFVAEEVCKTECHILLHDSVTGVSTEMLVTQPSSWAEHRCNTVKPTITFIWP